jgi:hypothetical protein
MPAGSSCAQLAAGPDSAAPNPPSVPTQEVVNSGYLRDSRVIAQAAKVAYDIRMGRTFDEKSPDFCYFSIVALLSIQHP